MRTFPAPAAPLQRLSRGQSFVLRFVLVLLAGWAATTAAARSDQPAPSIRYTVSLAHPEQHLVHVAVELPPGAAERDLQLPVWNALYQVRDFAQYVIWVRAENASRQKLTLGLVDKSHWRVSGAQSGARIEYEIFANDPGPYGAQLDGHHAFFNLAEIMLYPVDQRWSPVQLRLTDVPSKWRSATTLTVDSTGELSAENYDRMVDAPVEIGEFQESDFDQGGGHYRVVVDAEAADYNMEGIVSTVRRIVAAATAWMNDRPFATYLFLYHFPRQPGGGGMEHANSTAIDVNARVLADDPQSLGDVTAHEFFHLWNVKRIRPQSLEPVDYTRENYTNALWFSEGFTNTVQSYILLRAGLMDQGRYFKRLATDIEELERRPARRTESAEESSLDAWLEKYSAYQLPERSISYYNKGELLGVMLDLELRETSHGAASLRDLFQWMNENYAQKNRYFPDSDGVRQAAEAVSHGELGRFFQKYVAGTEAIPWDDFLKTVGLQLMRRTNTTAELGFVASANFGAPPLVSSVDPNSEAARAGLAVRDSILEINGRVISSDFSRQLAAVQPDEMIHLRVRNGRGEHEVDWKVASRKEVYFELKEVDALTAQQTARRTAWLSGEDQSQDQTSTEVAPGRVPREATQ